MNKFNFIHVCVYIYIYNKEREREREYFKNYTSMLLKKNNSLDIIIKNTFDMAKNFTFCFVSATD